MRPGADGFGPAFRVTVDVLIRECREEDLTALEWWGLYSPDRALIRREFERHVRGEAVMLVAEAGGMPSGQAWITLPSHTGGAALVWAVRVFPCLQGKGIGSRLIGASEHAAGLRGAGWAELTVDADNPRAQRLYERLGYQVVGSEPGPSGPRWLMRKRLMRVDGRHA